jgi:hypothetical protein
VAGHNRDLMELRAMCRKIQAVAHDATGAQVMDKDDDSAHQGPSVSKKNPA